MYEEYDRYDAHTIAQMTGESLKWVQLTIRALPWHYPMNLVPKPHVLRYFVDGWPKYGWLPPTVSVQQPAPVLTPPVPTPIQAPERPPNPLLKRKFIPCSSLYELNQMNGIAPTPAQEKKQKGSTVA